MGHVTIIEKLHIHEYAREHEAFVFVIGRNAAKGKALLLFIRSL